MNCEKPKQKKIWGAKNNGIFSKNWFWDQIILPVFSSFQRTCNSKGDKLF